MRAGLGNPGGGGRPRRAVEREYLSVLAEIVTLELWREICRTAAGHAKAGNHKAREWLAKLLLGAEPPSLAAIAALDAAGISADDEIEGEARRRIHLEELLAKDKDAPTLDGAGGRTGAATTWTAATIKRAGAEGKDAANASA